MGGSRGEGERGWEILGEGNNFYKVKSYTQTVMQNYKKYRDHLMMM